MLNDREKLIELTEEARNICEGRNYDDCKLCSGYGNGMNCIDHLIADHLIANNVVIREKGEWTRTYVGWKDCFSWSPCGNNPWACPHCGKIVSWMRTEPEWDFCPYCGDYMRGTENERKTD